MELLSNINEQYALIIELGFGLWKVVITSLSTCYICNKDTRIVLPASFFFVR